MNWHKVLLKINDKIQGNVLSVTHMRNTMPVQRFKDLLDKQAQDAIIETLDSLKADVTLVSEEGDQVFGEGTYTMVADPVDGTTNLARGLNPAVASISVSETGYQSGIVAGIVSNSFTGETFYAENGKGATGNIYIETAEKAIPREGPYVQSGIYRDDESWLYGIGDYSKFYIFGKKCLKKNA